MKLSTFFLSLSLSLSLSDNRETFDSRKLRSTQDSFYIFEVSFILKYNHKMPLEYNQPK